MFLATLLATLLLETTYAVDYVPNTGAGGQQQCEYKFTVKTPVDCSISDPGLKEMVQLMKQDIDMTRISAVSYNSAVQEQIATLKDGLDQLGVEVKEIKSSMVPAVLTPDVPRGRDWEQVKEEVKELGGRLSTLLDNVESQMMYMQKYLSSLNSTFTAEKVERFRIESNLQAQVNSVVENLEDVQKRILTLEREVPDM
ncbi:hypothetical protein PoB_006857500 [Plakobranchus ocellatus]|uniref:Secreted protein n=1 Tax=Plakobranchus ocellatus TaxID=259542 RepID=A0AAV4DD71_9GAST|nr:hypothetical protein PoB_006857500 [Plakobranchus ocellatus]